MEGSKMKSSRGLVALLERNGIKATGDSKKDIKLARVFMPVKRNRTGQTTKCK